MRCTVSPFRALAISSLEEDVSASPILRVPHKLPDNPVVSWALREAVVAPLRLSLATRTMIFSSSMSQSTEISGCPLSSASWLFLGCARVPFGTRGHAGRTPTPERTGNGFVASNLVTAGCQETVSILPDTPLQPSRPSPAMPQSPRSPPYRHSQKKLNRFGGLMIGCIKDSSPARPKAAAMQAERRTAS